MGDNRIGILTLPLSNNYGGIIQAAALYGFLEKEGYEPYLIRINHSTKYKYLLKCFLSNNPFYRFLDPKNLARKKQQDKKLQKFIKKFFKRRTKNAFCETSLKKAVISFNTVLVGSDQVWRYSYTKPVYKHYFLDFVPDDKFKIAYAASFGLERWEGDKDSEKIIYSLIDRFNAVSLREKTSLEYCESSLNVKAQHVLDPTFLVDKDFYVELFVNKNKNVGLFNYVLDHSIEKQDFVNTVASISKLKVDTINLTPNSFHEKPSISDWLQNLYSAEFVITDSFHGMIFSIIFNKQFIIIANKDRGYARFYSLLSDLNLLDRLVENVNEIGENEINMFINNKIEYGEVEAKLEVLKKKSRDFLLENLRNKK